MKKRWNIIKKILIVLFSFGVLGVVALLDPNVQNIGEALASVTPGWIVAAAGCGLGYYLMDSLMFYVSMGLMQHPMSMGQSIITTMVGMFYNALTPFQSGGQPMQVLQLRRQGVPVGLASGAMMVKFLGWHISVTFLGTAGLIRFGFAPFQGNVGGVIMLVVGYGIHVGAMLLAIAVMLRPVWIFHAGQRAVNGVHKLGFLRREGRLEAAQQTWERVFNDYRVATDVVLKHPLGMVKILAVGFLDALCYMAVTYCVYRAFGFQEFSAVYVILLQSLLFVAVSFIPLPGASVASEGGFYLVFSKLFTAATRFPAMLLWRVCTYYMNLILGLVAVIVDAFQKGKQEREEV